MTTRHCLACHEPLVGLHYKTKYHPGACWLARRKQLREEENRQKRPPPKACAVCGEPLAGLDPRSVTHPGDCEKTRRRAYYKERGRKRRGPRPLCAGLPKVVEPGLLLQAVPCSRRLGWGEELRCPECKQEALKRRQRRRWARQKGARACPCGAPLPVGTREERVEKYCRACRAGLPVEEKPKQRSSEDLAAEDFDVLRLLQEDSHDYCATKEAWAERVGRDPKDPDTDRQWTRLKNRLKKLGYTVENVEFDAVKDTTEGMVQNYRRWGVRVKQ